MRNEYQYLTKKPLEFPLDESIQICFENNDNEYIVSNKYLDNAHIFAHEIDYYIRNTRDSIASQISNIKKMYDARSIAYDLAQDMDYMVSVGKKVLLVSTQDNSELVTKLEKDSFTVISLNPKEIKDVNGHIGDLKVSTNKLMRGDLETDQIVWANAPAFAMKQGGVYDPDQIGWDKAIKSLYDNVDEYHYKNYVQYNPNICQYNGRLLEETCSKCEEVCPTVAIVKIDEDKHLEFSDVDCHGCGGCVSVCPSGAMDFTQMPRGGFSDASSFYSGHIPLIIPVEVELADIPLPPTVLPFGIEGRKFLSEVHLLTLLQKSGNPIIFYTDVVSKGTGDAIRIINEIFERKYNKKAVHVCQDKEELELALQQTESLEECMFDLVEDDMNKREVFTHRLSHLVGDDDLGIVKTGEHIHYGNININEDACTLCMACVGVCNVAALTAHPEDQTLKFNPSLCTNCGYCEVVCPEENCLEVVYDELSLSPSYFKKNTMAHDELFACVECGKEFATRKSIEKIAKMMTPKFGDDKARIRTLYCCPDCKPKVMIMADYNKETGKEQ
jgi:ferredoxin